MIFLIKLWCSTFQICPQWHPIHMLSVDVMSIRCSDFFTLLPKRTGTTLRMVLVIEFTETLRASLSSACLLSENLCPKMICLPTTLQRHDVPVCVPKLAS